jgi:sigma-B regulation protein RsbU (phosphoserine phosphatase)
MTALVRNTLRALSMHQGSPEAVMVDLNTAMRRSSRSEEAFCTAIFGYVTVTDGIVVRLASGGHPFPFLRRADGTVEEVQLGGSFLGAIDEVSVAVADVALAPGETIVFFTDGVLDARSGEVFFDVDGVSDVLATCGGSAVETAHAIEAAVLAHAGDRLDDDMALLVLRAT